MANISEINGYGIYAQTASLATSASSILVDREALPGPAYIVYVDQVDPSGKYMELHNNDTFYITGSTFVSPSIQSSFTGSLLGIASTASYIDPTFISASAAASGFGSGGGSGSSNLYRVINTTDGVSTNSTAVSASYSVEIPANTFAVGDIINIVYRGRKNPTTANCALGLYVNTSDTTTGATLLGIYTGNFRSYLMWRKLFIKDTYTEVYPVAVNQTFELNASTSNFSQLSIDWSQTQYIIFTSNLSSASDTWIASGYEIERLRTNI